LFNCFAKVHNLSSKTLISPGAFIVGTDAMKKFHNVHGGLVLFELGAAFAATPAA